MQSDISQWNKYASLYNKGKGYSGDSLHKNLIQPFLEKSLPKNRYGVILDAGCGNGFLDLWLSNQFKSVVAIDSSEELLTFAKENVKASNVSFQFGDLTKTFPFNDDSFDIVLSVMVVQYLPKLDVFAKEVSRVLKSGGSFVCAIDHPGHALFLRAQELVGKKNEKFITSGSYFEKGLRKKHSLWDKAILQYYHRTISDYINAFSKYLTLDSIEEVSDDGEVPRILGLKFKK